VLFKKSDIFTKDFGVDFQVHEYRNSDGEQGDFLLDGAVSELNTSFGPKIQEFTELFFLLSGELDVEMNGQTVTLHPEDMFIVPAGVEHSIIGRQARIFIVCNPPFDPEKMKMV